MAVDLKDKGVVVVILHPGIVRTGLDPETHGVEGAVEVSFGSFGLVLGVRS